MMSDIAADQAKQSVRERIWELLEREDAVPELGVHGRIPNFKGADAAAERLATLPAWQAARVVKAVPDRAQLPVRQRALQDGKLVYMAVPKLADVLPFYLIDLRQLGVSSDEAASKEAAAKLAPRVGVDQMPPVDLVICGSVAVNRAGVRLGKGAGYSDIELALLQEAKLIGSQTTIVTTVHSLQVVDEELPETAHDYSVDMIVTPEEIIQCGSPRRPQGLVWDHLEPEKIAAIPVLRSKAPNR
jgi:5-formyltetrahydrofolate cyclo-ligase